MRIVRVAFVAALFTALSGPAAAVPVSIENFNTDGDGTRYTLVGGGFDGADVWDLESNTTPLGFTGQEGADFLAGSDLDAVFGGGAPRQLLFPLTALDLSTAASTTLSIMFAANDAGVWDVGQDFIRIIAIDNDTSDEFILEEFLPNGVGNLEALVAGENSGMVLDTEFAVANMTIPGSIDSLTLRIEVFSTSNAEYLGIDDAQIDITPVIPEPNTAALLGLGLVSLAASRRKARRR